MLKEPSGPETLPSDDLREGQDSLGPVKGQNLMLEIYIVRYSKCLPGGRHLGLMAVSSSSQ